MSAEIKKFSQAAAPVPQTRADRLSASLADGILGGAFPAGMRLDEHMLAERFGVSRTPVREALRQLASTGLIEMRARRGAFVTSVTGETLAGLFVAMGEIEATCARLCALGMNPVERRRLKSLHEAMGLLAARDARAEYADANRDMHHAIYAGAHNAVLFDIAIGLRRRLDPFRRAQFRAPGRLQRSHREHELVAAAILSGDPGGAHSAMLDHVHSVETAFERMSLDQGLLAV